MKVLPQIIALSCLLLYGTGCATPYLTDRGRDAADVFTLCAGVGAGAKVQIGPAHLGLIANADITGLRGGRLFTLKNRNELGMPDSIDLEALLYGMSYFNYDPRNMRHKNYQDGPYKISMWNHREIPMPFLRKPSYPKRSCPSYFTQIEATVGLLLTVRVGLNPGELLDFILGWGNIDIYGDDIERKKKESNHGLESTGAPPAAKAPETHP